MEYLNPGVNEVIPSFIFLILLTLTSNNVTFESSAIAQSSGNEKQVWTDTENNVKIIFTYSPENPVINTPTQLRFSVDNLRTGVNIKNLLATVVIISNSSGHEKIFRFKNITASNGNFSLQYVFRNLGNYQVITRINSTNPSSITLASFQVIVMLETGLLNIVITGITILVIFGSGAYLAIIIKRKQLRKK